jgi:RDD family
VAELAERGARLLATATDELILLGISLPMLFGSIPAVAARLAQTDVSAGDPPESLDSLESALASIPVRDLLHTILFGPGTIITVLALIVWCVITVWWVSANGQSIGKRLVGIKVVRKDGSRASFARIFLLRNVVNTVPALLPYVGLLYQLVDPLLIYQESRQCIHDKIADTVVVRCRQ